jgi:transposase
VRQFKLSTDPQFAAKLHDIVGLYIDPPAHAIVLSVDEKSQIQALDRTQPSLPLKKGRAGTMTHDYKRNGTTTLFAAFDVLDGKVIGRCMQRHRHQEFIRFLNAIEREVPAGKIVHAILDNYGAHKHPKVRAWLGRHPRFVFHYTPTSCSWLNAVEGFFAKLTRRRLKRGVFRSIVELQAAINRFLAETNENPKPFTWTADPDKIIAAVRRGHQMLDSIHYVYPDGPIATEAFRVIGQAMAEVGMAGIGTITLSRRERMVMVEPRGAGLMLVTLRAADEVRAANFDDAEAEVDADMVAIASMIIKRRTGAFDPSTFRDRYQEALRDLIEAKLKGRRISAPGAVKPPPSLDLMAALKRSLAETASNAAAAPKRQRKAQPDRRQKNLLLPVSGKPAEPAASATAPEATWRRRRA